MNVQNVLDGINVTIERKRTLDKIILELNKLPTTSIKKEYGLYLIPDDPNAFGKCDSISEGIDWKGLHITIAGFTENNGKIPAILKQIDNQSLKTKKWNPHTKNVITTSHQYDIKSDSLDNLSKLLKEAGLDNVHPDWHIYCKNGINQNPKFKGTTWSLIMIEKVGTNITWRHDVKIPFYDMHVFHDIHIQDNNTLKVMTYNIWWKAMMAQHSECNAGKCVDNIANVINTSNYYDFIGLQEASYTHLLDAKCPVLAGMNSYKTKAGIEDCVTYYNKKYTLEFSGTDTIVKKARPMQILIFSQGIIFINAHLGHYSKINKIINDINWCINQIIKNISNINHIFANHRIIMVGDFNYNIKAEKNPFPIQFNGIVRYLHINPTNLNTCCNTGNLFAKRNHHADNILDSKGPPIMIKIAKEIPPASDHAPVFAELLK